MIYYLLDPSFKFINITSFYLVESNILNCKEEVNIAYISIEKKANYLEERHNQATADVAQLGLFLF